MPRLARFVLGLGLCFSGSTVFAQSALTELYGEGVHKFYAGDLATADQYLSQVIDSGIDDPRAYYFRGLVREMQGGGGEYDFETAARLEAEGSRSFNIGLALSRIQGHTRAKIEKLRLDARVAAQQQALLMERARSGAGNAAPAPREQPVVPPVDATDPFGGTDAAPTPPTIDPVQPVVPEIDAQTDPFADDPATGSAVPAPATDSAVPTPTESSDPFGGDAAGGDPFGTDPASDTPASDTPASDLDDPFGT